MAALGASSTKTAPRAAQPAVKRVAAKRTAPAPTPVPYRPGRVPQPPGVEPGVTGKEKRFQQSRAFGPGPIKPYPHGPRQVNSSDYERTSQGTPTHGRRGQRMFGSERNHEAVITGGTEARPRPIPNVKGRPRRTTA